MACSLKIKLTLSFLLSMFCYSVALSFANKNTVDQFDTIRITIGETTTLKSSENSELYINRKGIIAAQYLDHGNWRIIALKVGTTLVQSEEKSWLIQVANKPRAPLVHTSIPNWICKKGLECSEDEQIISGTSTDPFLFIKAKNWCLNQKSCMFVGALSESAVSDLHEFYRAKLNVNHKLLIHPSGVSEFFLPCEYKQNTPNKSVLQKIKLLTKMSGQQRQHLFTCKQTKPKNFHLKSKVVLASNLASDIMDLDPNAEVTISKFAQGKLDRITKTIQLLISKKKALIIGQPNLSLLEGQKGLIKSGGEFPVLINSGSDVYGQSWKNFGLSLSATLRSHEQRIIGNIDFSLSTKGSKANNNLISSSISTAVRIIPGTETLIGSVEIKTKQSTKKENSIFGKTPLIGPFFQTREEEDTYSKLLLFIQVD